MAIRREASAEKTVKEPGVSSGDLGGATGSAGEKAYVLQISVFQTWPPVFFQFFVNVIDLQDSRLDCQARKLVTTLVFLLARMAAQPFESNLVNSTQVQEPFPKVRIQGPLSSVAPPGMCLPTFCPAELNCVDQVLRIAPDGDAARPLECLQADDCRHNFHAIVSRFSETCGKLSAMLSVQEDDPISPGAGIVNASAIRIDGYFRTR